MKPYLLLIWLLPSLSCNFSSSLEKNGLKSHDPDQEESVSPASIEQEAFLPIVEEKENIASNQNVAPPFPPIDTLSLRHFWQDFQHNLQNDRRQEVIKVLDFPVHAIFPVLFRYAHDCDTLAYMKNEEQYGDFDIDRDNISEYYDFVFTDVLKTIIAQTSADNLLSKGYRNKKIPGLTYVFFPKNYKVKVNCPNDHNLKFYLTWRENRWHIEIGGL